MKAMAQKQISDFFYHETKETVKIIKYCKYKITNETEDNKRWSYMFKQPQSVRKTSEKTCRVTKRVKKPKGVMEVLYTFQDLLEMVKYEEFYEHTYVEEFQVNWSISKTRKRLSSWNKLGICQ